MNSDVVGPKHDPHEVSGGAAHGRSPHSIAFRIVRVLEEIPVLDSFTYSVGVFVPQVLDGYQAVSRYLRTQRAHGREVAPIPLDESWICHEREEK